jgi:hypothetical protein
MADNNLGIGTRSRSRSKTPGLMFGENGDSKPAKKIPSISLIEEEDVIEVPLSQPSSQRPKRQRRSAKATQSDTSGDVINESPINSQNNSKQTKSSNTNTATTTTTSTTTVVTSEQITNGSEKKAESTTTVTKVSSNNEVASEVPENQSIFNNIFNAIKTSTPILSSKRAKRFTQTEITKASSDRIDFNEHPAYKEYKEAGEYWNKYPKTDYTYSELSPHRRQLANGVVAMPNMSRRSLEKYTNRVEAMIQQNPTEESFLRRKFLSSNISFQKKSADLQYDSADEVDVSDLYQRLAARRYSNTSSNFFTRLYVLIVSALTSAYSNAKQGVRRIFYKRTNHYAYTPVKYYQQQQQGIKIFLITNQQLFQNRLFIITGFFTRVFNTIQTFVLLCASKVYLSISTILCLDTWLLYTRRSDNTNENRKRKRFLLGLLVLLPLLLFGGEC